jgi:hypothetical protein
MIDTASDRGEEIIDTTRRAHPNNKDRVATMTAIKDE